MKKLINFIFLSIAIMICGILKVKALSPNAEEILDIISKERKLNITSISTLSPSIVDGVDAYDLSYSNAIEAYLYQLPEVKEYFDNHKDHEFIIRIFCHSVDNCYIMVDDSEYNLYIKEKEEADKFMETPGEIGGPPGYGYEKIEISINIVPDNKKNQKAFDLIQNQGKKSEEGDGLRWHDYYLYDLGYINLMYNTDFDLSERNSIKRNSINNIKLLKYFPEIKDVYEKIDNYNFLYAGPSAAGDYINSVGIELTSDFVPVYNNVVYGYQVVRFNLAPILLISNKTEDLKIIETASNKIKDYIGNQDVNVEITYLSASNSDINNEISLILNKSLETENVSYSSDKYTLKIGNKTSDLFIVKVDDEYVDNFKTKSYSLNSGLMMTSTGLDVPFDSSLEVTNVTDKYKDDESMVSAYDINLYSLYKDGYIKESVNGFAIMIPVNDDFDESKHKLHYIDDNGNKKEEYEYIVENVNGQKYISFTTNHLSVYALVEETIKNEEKVDNFPNESDKDQPLEKEPPTGYITPMITISILLSISIISIILIKNKVRIRKL